MIKTLQDIEERLTELRNDYKSEKSEQMKNYYLQQGKFLLRLKEEIKENGEK